MSAEAQKSRSQGVRAVRRCLSRLSADSPSTTEGEWLICPSDQGFRVIRSCQSEEPALHPRWPLTTFLGDMKVLTA